MLGSSLPRGALPLRPGRLILPRTCRGLCPGAWERGRLAGWSPDRWFSEGTASPGTLWAPDRLSSVHGPREGHAACSPEAQPALDTRSSDSGRHRCSPVHAAFRSELWSSGQSSGLQAASACPPCDPFSGETWEEEEVSMLTAFCHREMSLCCSVAKSCLTLCDPVDCNTPGYPVLHLLPELAQTHVR